MPPTTDPRHARGLQALKALALLTSLACLVLGALVLQLTNRVATAEASAQAIDGRLVRIYERVRAVQVLMEDRARAAGLPVPPAPVDEPEPIDGR